MKIMLDDRDKVRYGQGINNGGFMKTIENTKTQNTGIELSRYKRTSDGVEMIEVRTMTGQVAYWLARNCKAA